MKDIGREVEDVDAKEEEDVLAVKEDTLFGENNVLELDMLAGWYPRPRGERKGVFCSPAAVAVSVVEFSRSGAAGEEGRDNRPERACASCCEIMPVRADDWAAACLLLFLGGG